MAEPDAPLIAEESVVINAPIEAVFRALTDPDELVQWWGSPDSYQCEVMEADLRPGGSWKTSGTGSDGTPFSVSGTYTIVEPPSCVAFTWQYSWKPGAETLVRYDLSEDGGATTLHVTHTGFGDVADRDDHARGWHGVFAWLRAFVEAPVISPAASRSVRSS